VPDLARSQAFYRAVLGWEFTEGAEEFGGYTTALVADEDTAGYERRHYENHQPDRYLLENSLEDLLTIVHS
jgi:catechol 2,3-dioxygenase-like lactoylglutathione lyase family enzyme